MTRFRDEHNFDFPLSCTRYPKANKAMEKFPNFSVGNFAPPYYNSHPNPNQNPPKIIKI
jgi:hypothetical protein